ncbi:MAG: tetraacyldisaccharide 4'-kinase [Bdellovibrionales bacterium]|nr:tetraacyldisaccharide 4'-kinase [Bdellovibrionales bacterium]
MRIFVSAAEISSDLQAEKVLRAFLGLHHEKTFEIFGIGGPALRSIPGFHAIEKTESMRAMGFVEVISKIFFLKRTMNRVIEHLDHHPPDIILTVDYPDFHFSLMKRLKTRSWFRGTLRICGIPPKVWVWRSGRVKRIKELYSGVWVIFPFEKAFYQTRGIPVIFEGNPLIADLVSKATSKDELMSDDEVRVAVLPGSRDAELKSHLPIVGPALSELSQLTGKRVHAEVPIPPGMAEQVFSRELVSTDRVHYRLVPSGSAEVLSRNSIGLIKSGTSTLEAAVLGCVPVIFYRMNPLSEWIFKKFVRYSGPVGLPNILLGIKERSRSVFPEYLGADAMPDLLATALHRLVDQPETLQELVRKGEQLRASLVPDGEVSLRIAERISDWVELHPSCPPTRKVSGFIGALSFIWSTLNRTRRWMRFLSGISPAILPVRSILVGNLQAGGAGKTPMVIGIAREAIERGFRVGVISRGYGRRRSRSLKWVEAGDDAHETGDEALEIKMAVPGAAVVLSSNRLRAAQELLKAGVDLIIADDGYQNLGFKTDRTVLLVTDVSRMEMPYRDFDSEASKADFLIQLKGSPTSRFPHVRRLDWSVSAIPPGQLWLWTAIADPAELIGFYEQRGVRFKRIIAARDHFHPDPEDFFKLLQAAESEGARIAVTPKDAVKIAPPHRNQCIILSRNLKKDPFFMELFEGLQ